MSIGINSKTKKKNPHRWLQGPPKGVSVPRPLLGQLTPSGRGKKIDEYSQSYTSMNCIMEQVEQQASPHHVEEMKRLMKMQA
jgi:hypothetical protein